MLYIHELQVYFSAFWRLTNQVLRKHKDKSLGTISGPIEEKLSHNLTKDEYFDDFFVNIHGKMTRKLDPLDVLSINTFISEIIPTGAYIDFDSEYPRETSP